MNKQVNHGFIAPAYNPDHYILGQGKVPGKILKPDRDWTSPLLIEEVQAKKFETYNCTGFAAAKQIENYFLVAFGVRINLSARWIGIIAATNVMKGNDPHIVYEAIRRYGVIPEEMLPYDDTIDTFEKYYSFYGADKKECYRKAQEWKDTHDFKHEWVFEPHSFLSKKDKETAIYEALQYSCLGIGVYAWKIDGRGVYIRGGEDCHWTLLDAVKDYQKVFDSYNPFNKNAEQELFLVKRIHIEKTKPPLMSKTFLVQALESLFKALQVKHMENREIIYNTAVSCLGKDVTPEDLTPDDLDCADTLSTVLKLAGFPIGDFISTYKLYFFFKGDKFWTRVDNPLPGDVIISPSGFGKDHGHVGIVGKNNVIMSNSSTTGKFTENFTLDSWNKKYKVDGGFPVIFFRRV